MDLVLFLLGFLLLWGAIVYLIVSLVKKKFQGKRFGLLIAASIVIMIVGLSIPSEESAVETASQVEEKETDSDKEKQEDEEEKKKQAEEKAKEEEEAAKKAEEEKIERESLIAAFNIVANEVVKSSNGIISDIVLDEGTNHFSVRVYVDESTWARSNESEKMSFATTMGTSIENALSPNSTYVDIMSSTNNDVLATQKLFGGWKIKR